MTPKEQGYFDYSQRNTPVEPDNPDYMRGWNDAESDEEDRLTDQAEEPEYYYEDPDYDD